jgi:dihydrofolate reductase
MPKLIAAMNLTLDGYCNHDIMYADDEIHEHYNNLLRNAVILIYGRKTYQLMEAYWPGVVKNPTGNKATDEFGMLINNIPKIVYSRTLTDVSWKNSTLKHEIIKEEILVWKRSTTNGKNIVVGSPSLIVELANLNLVDEFQLGVQPIIAGDGLRLFKNISKRIDLELLKTKKFQAGAIMLYYKTKNSER